MAAIFVRGRAARATKERVGSFQDQANVGEAMKLRTSWKNFSGWSRNTPWPAPAKRSKRSRSGRILFAISSDAGGGVIGSSSPTVIRVGHWMSDSCGKKLKVRSSVLIHSKSKSRFQITRALASLPKPDRAYSGIHRRR